MPIAFGRTLLVVSCALGLLPIGAACAAPPLEIAPVQWRERTLVNGLQVITSQSRASPTASVQVWYHVGGRDDPPGRSGFAHLFEHLMFKSTRYLRAEQFDRLTEDVGGANNAFTSEDVTAYQDVVPSNHLEALLWAEAERMSNLRVEPAAFASERAVVEEEYRQRILAEPYGRFFDAVTTLPYREHAYRRSSIGSIDDLEAATLADVVAFHARHYRPDNATLVVTGDFEPAQADAWIDRYFGAVPRPSEPLPAFSGAEPPWPRDREATVMAPRVPLPAVAVAWLAPPVTSPDAAALRVTAAILSAGDSSRLHKSLVYRQRIAAQAGFNADLRIGPGLLVAYAIASGAPPAIPAASGIPQAMPAASDAPPAARGASVAPTISGAPPSGAFRRTRSAPTSPIAAATSALLAEVRRLARDPPSAAELAKVKNQIVTQELVARQTPLGLASALAEAAVLHRDTAYVNEELKALQRVGAGDVQRVVRRHLLDAHQITVIYRQADSAAAR